MTYRVHYINDKGGFMSPPMTAEEAQAMMSRMEADPDILKIWIEPE